MMSVHPLFSGFAGVSLCQLGAALGFVLHAEVFPGSLPPVLPVDFNRRLKDPFDLGGYWFAGGWDASGVHCLLFAKPLSVTAQRCWQAALEGI